MPQNSPDNLGRLVLDYLGTELGTFESGQLIPSPNATKYLATYLNGDPESETLPFVGRHFDELSIPDENPNEITASDIVAVSFLSVSIPPAAAWALLHSRKNKLTEILSEITPDLAIDDPNCDYGVFDENSSLQQLWTTLRRNASGDRWGMGPVLTSKLMARKRPHLVPIQDSIVLAELHATDRDFWRMWWQAMQLTDSGHRPVRYYARKLRDSVPAAHELSLLRVLDIVIWMNGKARRATA